jgi:hypothetical protein
MEVKRIATAHDGVGDICAITTNINGQRALLVTAYITPGTPILKVRQFFVLNLMAYSNKFRGILKELDSMLLDSIPIVPAGDFILDLKSADGTEFITIMRDYGNWI